MQRDANARGYLLTWVLFVLILLIVVLAAGVLYLVALRDSWPEAPPFADLPEVESGVEISSEDSERALVVGLSADGRVFHSSRRVTLDELADDCRLHVVSNGGARNAPPRPIHLRFHRGAAWRHARWVLCVLAEAGIDEVSLLAHRESATVGLALLLPTVTHASPGKRTLVRAKAHSDELYSLDGLEAMSAARIVQWVRYRLATDCAEGILPTVDAGPGTRVQAFALLLAALEVLEPVACEKILTEPPPPEVRRLEQLP